MGKELKKNVVSYLSLPSLLSTAEAIHLGSLIAAHGYIFPISDHVLTLKDDGTLYRFQVQSSTFGKALINIWRPLRMGWQDDWGTCLLCDANEHNPF